MSLIQGHRESFNKYAFAKLRFAELCPVHLSDLQNIEYFLQDLRVQHIITALAASWPSTVKYFIVTCTSIDKFPKNISEPTSLIHLTPQAQSSHAVTFSERLAKTSQCCTASHARTGIARLPANQQEARYAIGKSYSITREVR